MNISLWSASLLLASSLALHAQEPTKPTKRVALAQSCFWSGEMRLGQIDGVVRTEAGFIQGREVTLVEYAPAQISLEKLVRQARQAGVADQVHLESGANGVETAGVPVGAPLEQNYRAAPAGDQKKQIEGTPFAQLNLTPEQATKVNAFVRVNPSKALEFLTAAQREKLAGSH